MLLSVDSPKWLCNQDLKSGYKHVTNPSAEVLINPRTPNSRIRGGNHGPTQIAVWADDSFRDFSTRVLPLSWYVYYVLNLSVLLLHICFSITGVNF